MTILAAILIIGGLVLTIALIVGVIFLVSMMVYSEVSHSAANRPSEPEVTAQPTRIPAHTAPAATRAVS